MFTEEQKRHLLESFIEEAHELVQRSEEALQLLKRDSQDVNAINELFRAIHTLKGSSGVLDLEELVNFNHVFEDLLMKVRDQVMDLDAELINLFLECVDQISDMVESVDHEHTDHHQERALELIGKLESLLHKAEENSLSEQVVSQSDCAANRMRNWLISVRFDESLFENGFDPASFIQYLSTLGSIEKVAFIDNKVPSDLVELDPAKCLFGLEMSFHGQTTKEEIYEVFEFIDELCELKVLPPESALQDYIEQIEALPEDDMKLGEMLVSIGLITQDELEESLTSQAQNENHEPLGKVLIKEQQVSPEIVDASLEKQKKSRGRKRQSTFLKVSAEKVDSLINQVGELVISAAGAKIKSNQHDDAELKEALENLLNRVEMIRESSLQLRMVEINETFSRFSRIVRETSSSLDKEIELVLEGQDTELDKNLVAGIYEPLVHLVRNAIDHGLESPAERKAVNKNPKGTVKLSARHESGSIVIEVEDDGRGINAERVRQKALDQGLISHRDELSENEIHQLILHAGFSTANEVSDLSGRGVGLDSVRKDIEHLRGSLEIESAQGEGTCFRIKLPLTLAMIEGFQVSVGQQDYVIPVEWVEECIETPEQFCGGKETGFSELRGAPLPFTSLGRVLGVPHEESTRQSMVILSSTGQSVGVIVDVLHGEIQSVIKPLGPMFEQVQCISGSTILGSGKVALTLDVPGLISEIKQNTQLNRVA